jgi:hypothetical protein
MAITTEEFLFRRNFPTLSNDDIGQAITEVSAQWSGTQSFWAWLPPALQESKRDMVLHLLTAWHLADMFPEDLDGVAANGGMPLQMKSISGVDIKFLPLETQEAMYPLLSNTFGIRAMQMIHSAPERFSIQ